MRQAIHSKVVASAPGATNEAWADVIAAAEADPHARIPGSLRHDHQPDVDVALSVKIKSAAVLVPLVTRGNGFTVLLTRRPEHLSEHPGQVSFPGGRVEPEDRGPVETALRETEEEVGLPRARVEVAGRLENYLVGTGYRVTPVVGFVDPPAAYAPDATEVAEVFEVPLEFVLDPANYRREKIRTPVFERHFHVLEHNGHVVWGATAGILVNLRDILNAPE
ncbi:MAG: CoA pyrophosphatase [Alphaproteobacteria bacterium]|jgi:8-oxo-dGTP pyrophosphatase MutT (NUDIX family)|nr:CoA pyrophosphatase [Alphaproteobacteria bacterium]